MDAPPAPFADIPIDAFSVDPGAYAPFLPADLRDAVVGTLRAGEAVIGQASADLRGIGAGGAMTFGDRTVKVGLVAPDGAVGWSELLVSREVGRSLGITDERYLLAQMRSQPTDAAFGRLIGSLLPDGTPLRVQHTGETPYLRVASGVNPPVVMKGTFGEFAAHPTSRPRVSHDRPDMGARAHPDAVGAVAGSDHVQSRPLPHADRVAERGAAGRTRAA